MVSYRSADTSLRRALAVLFLQCVIRSSDALAPDLEGLKLVHIVFRHGDRTPINPYPTDPYKDRSYWPEGFGELTNAGKMRHYRKGQFLRQRYDGFLSDKFSVDEVHIRSTDVDRCLESAQANMAGLFPVKDLPNNWNPQLAWDPVPVHTLPQTEDYLLSSHAECPRFNQLKDELVKSDEFKKLHDDNRELFEYVSKNSGRNVSDITELDYIYDTLLVESQNNLTLPEWTKPIFPEGKFKELRDLSFLVDTWTHELKRLKGGPFIGELMKNCEEMAAGKIDPPQRKLFVFSGHDTTVAPILNTLGMFEPPVAPQYAATIIFELLERKNTFFMRVSYKNESDHEPYIMKLPKCDELCPLSEFKKLTASFVPANWRSECGFPLNLSLNVGSSIAIVAAVSSSLMAVIVIISVVLMLCKKMRGDHDHSYQKIASLDDV